MCKKTPRESSSFSASTVADKSLIVNEASKIIKPKGGKKLFTLFGCSKLDSTRLLSYENQIVNEASKTRDTKLKKKKG